MFVQSCFSLITKKTSTVHITLYEGYPPVAGGFPSQWASDVEIGSMPWRLMSYGCVSKSSVWDSTFIGTMLLIHTVDFVSHPYNMDSFVFIAMVGRAWVISNTLSGQIFVVVSYWLWQWLAGNQDISSVHRSTDDLLPHPYDITTALELMLYGRDGKSSVNGSICSYIARIRW